MTFAKYGLALWAPEFQAMWDGRRLFDFRYVVDDALCQEYITGSTLTFWETERDTDNFTGRYIVATVTHVVPSKRFRLADGLCLFGIQIIGKSDGKREEEVRRSYSANRHELVKGGEDSIARDVMSSFPACMTKKDPDDTAKIIMPECRACHEILCPPFEVCESCGAKA
jgi:hypothetical protein